MHNSTPARDHNEQHYYAAPQTTKNVLKQPLSTADAKLHSKRQI